VITKNYVLPISPIVTPPAPVQPGGTIPIPPPRLVTAMWRSGTLWTTTVDGCTPPGSTVPRSCLRLVGFTAPDSAAAPTVAHEFDVGDANMDYFAPAVATNGYGDLVIAASESNTHINPTLALLAERPPFTGITGFLYDDRSNEPYEGPDWGGYSAVAVNPTDPASVWTDAQEQIGYSYPDEPNWMTFGVEVLANTPKSWPGATPAFGTRYNQTATLIYRRADGKLEWLQSADPCPNCWDRAQAFTPAGGTNAAPALDPDLGFGFENLFTRRSTEHIWWDTALDGGAWYDLGGYATSAPTALPAAGGCALSVFVRGSNGAVYRKVKSSTSLAWAAGSRSAARSAPAPNPARSSTAPATKPCSCAAPTTRSTGNTAATAARPGAAGHPWAVRPTTIRPPPPSRPAPSTCSCAAPTMRFTPVTSTAAAGATGPISADQ
jgi:hypothetical protein